MRRLNASLFGACLLGALACEGPSASPDASALDASVDAGGALDSGVADDAAASEDAGGDSGAEPSLDAGAPDAGPPVDAGPRTYMNPVIDEFLGDPFAIEIDGVYHLYAPSAVRRGGQTVGGEVLAYTSTDLVNWEPRGSVFDNIDVAYGGDESRGLWAPEVLAYEGRYFLFYVNNMSGGASESVGNKDIAVVASDDPLDFRGGRSTVLLDDGFAFIDPSPFLDPSTGQLYLLFKRRAELGETVLRIRPMANPRTFNGGATRLVGSSEIEGSANIVEHPMMFRQGDVYFFVFSFGHGAHAGADGYQVGYSTGGSPVGPFTYRGVLFGRDTLPGGRPVFAPGATSLVRDGDGRAWMVYRQKTTRADGFGDRKVCIERVRVLPGASPPRLEGTPTRGVELPAPAPLSP